MENRLRKLRKEKGLSLRKASDVLDVAKSTLADYEKGKTEPKSSFLQRASNYYNVSIDYILGKSDYRNIEAKVKSLVPEGTLEYLDKEEINFLKDLAQDEQRQVLMRETQGMDEEDLAKFIRMAKAFEEEQTD